MVGIDTLSTVLTIDFLCALSVSFLFLVLFACHGNVWQYHVKEMVAIVEFSFVGMHMGFTDWPV